MQRCAAILLALLLGCNEESSVPQPCLESAGPLCTRVLAEGLEGASDLHADESQAVLVSAGALQVLNLQSGGALAIEPGDPESRFSTPAISQGLLAVKQLGHDEVFAYLLMDTSGTLIAEIAASPFAPKQVEEFETTPLAFAGDYLAYFVPTPDAQWELIVTQLIREDGGMRLMPLGMGKGSAASEVALDAGGRVLLARAESDSWDKRILELFTPNWAGAVPRAGSSTRIVSTEEGIQIGWPRLQGDLVLYELTAMATFGAGMASAIMLTDLDRAGYDWFIAGQEVWTGTLVLWGPALEEGMLGWLDGRIDPENPAVALRSYELVQPKRSLDLVENYAIYPLPGAKITEFVLAGGAIVWLAQEGEEGLFTLYLTEIN